MPLAMVLYIPGLPWRHLWDSSKRNADLVSWRSYLRFCMYSVFIFKRITELYDYENQNQTITNGRKYILKAFVFEKRRLAYSVGFVRRACITNASVKAIICLKHSRLVGGEVGLRDRSTWQLTNLRVGHASQSTHLTRPVWRVQKLRENPNNLLLVSNVYVAIVRKQFSCYLSLLRLAILGITGRAYLFLFFAAHCIRKTVAVWIVKPNRQVDFYSLVISLLLHHIVQKSKPSPPPPKKNLHLITDKPQMRFLGGGKRNVLRASF